MLDEAQLKSEFSYNGFRSYYSHLLAAKQREYPFYGGDKEFEILTKAVMTENYSRYKFPCFGDFQSILRGDDILSYSDTDGKRTLKENYELYIVINTLKEKAQSRCQYCWMSAEELVDHINIVKSLFEGFEFSVMSDSKNGMMRVKFLFLKNSISFFQIRFLLTWMRYSYEWAISMSTMDAYRLYNHPEYLPELAKENIFNLVQITNKLTYPYILGDQVINRLGLPMNIDRFKEKVNKRSNTSLCGDIYTSASSGDFAYITQDKGYLKRAKIEPKHYLSIAWWHDEDSFIAERLPLYRQYVETLKTKYDYEPAK